MLLLSSHLVGLALGIAHTRFLQTPPRLQKIVQVSTAISNVGNLPLVMVLSFVKNPNLPFNTANEADLAVTYVMLGWFYATMIQMPLGGCRWLETLSFSKRALTWPSLQIGRIESVYKQQQNSSQRSAYFNQNAEDL